jgi:hypothetical protein
VIILLPLSPPLTPESRKWSEKRRKTVPSATNRPATIELLDVVFSVKSVSNKIHNM